MAWNSALFQTAHRLARACPVRRASFLPRWNKATWNDKDQSNHETLKLLLMGTSLTALTAMPLATGFTLITADALADWNTTASREGI